MKNLYKTTIILILLSINNLAFGSKGDLPSDLKGVLEIFNKEQTDSMYAMHELISLHKNEYGIGETFSLQTSNGECESVKLEKTLGQGGSKKAVLLTDGRVIMLPNTDVDYYVRIARWWPDTVTDEAAMADFLEEIDVPALNRQKAYLIIPSKKDSTISYKLPVLLSDSFAQYEDRGWCVLDYKNGSSCSHIQKDWETFWKTDLKSSEKIFDLLIRDLLILSLNGISLNSDSTNAVVIKKDDGSFKLRYFGFDFGGKYGATTVPSEKKRSMSAQKTKEQICSEISKNANLIIEASVGYGVLEDDSLAQDIANHFSSCEYIMEILSNLNLRNHDLTEL